MFATDALHSFRQPPSPQQAPMQPDPIWGDVSNRQPLHFGGRWIHPQDPMYDFIQRIMLQQLMPKMQVPGAQG